MDFLSTFIVFKNDRCFNPQHGGFFFFEREPHDFSKIVFQFIRHANRYMPGIIDTDDGIAEFMGAIADSLDVISALFKSLYPISIGIGTVLADSTHQAPMVCFTAECDIMESAICFILFKTGIVGVATIIVIITQRVIFFFRRFLAVLVNDIGMPFQPFSGSFLAFVENLLLVLA